MLWKPMLQVPWVQQGRSRVYGSWYGINSLQTLHFSYAHIRNMGLNFWTLAICSKTLKANIFPWPKKCPQWTLRSKSVHMDTQPWDGADEKPSQSLRCATISKVQLRVCWFLKGLTDIAGQVFYDPTLRGLNAAITQCTNFGKYFFKSRTSAFELVGITSCPFVVQGHVPIYTMTRLLNHGREATSTRPSDCIQQKIIWTARCVERKGACSRDQCGIQNDTPSSRFPITEVLRQMELHQPIVGHWWLYSFMWLHICWNLCDTTQYHG